MELLINEDSEKKTLVNVEVGHDVKIYDFVNAYQCCIGDGCKIGAFVEIQEGVTVGKNCKISSHTFICEGVKIKNEVFVGHNVSFINTVLPRAVNENGKLQTKQDWKLVETVIEDGVSIGTSATIMGGITIGKNAVVGAGAVVVDSVPGNAVVAGNPAKILRFIDE